MSVVVEGESVVRWELEFLEEDRLQYNVDEVASKARTYIADMLQIEGFGPVKVASIRQTDRVLSVKPGAAGKETET